MYAPSPPRTTTSASVDQSPRILPPPPPRIDARREHQARNDEEAENHDPVLLIRGERQSLILRLAGPDRNQVLLLRQPVERVHEEVAITLHADGEVGGEIGIA